MTNKDYKAIAQAINNVRSGTIDMLSKEETLRYVVISIADAMHTDNNKFSHQQFYDACNIKGQ